MKFTVTYIKETKVVIQAESLQAACEIAEKEARKKKLTVKSVIPIL